MFLFQDGMQCERKKIDEGTAGLDLHRLYGNPKFNGRSKYKRGLHIMEKYNNIDLNRGNEILCRTDFKLTTVTKLALRSNCTFKVYIQYSYLNNLNYYILRVSLRRVRWTVYAFCCTYETTVLRNVDIEIMTRKKQI